VACVVLCATHVHYTSCQRCAPSVQCTPCHILMGYSIHSFIHLHATNPLQGHNFPLGAEAYSVSSVTGKMYIGWMGCAIKTGHNEHVQHRQVYQPGKSAVAEHSIG
jgi:hypothetical protein